MRAIKRSLVVASLAAVMATVAISPAVAWESAVFNGSPSRCSGGYVGSSWFSGATHSASAGKRDGSICILTSPQYGAAARYSDRTISVNYSSSYAVSNSVKLDSSVGGRHFWGNVGNLT